MGLALVARTCYLHLLSLRWNNACKLLLRDMVLNISVVYPVYVDWFICTQAFLYCLTFQFWVFLMKVIPETCRVHYIWYLHVCSINVSNCFSYIVTTKLFRGGRPRKLKRTETETLVIGYCLEITVEVGTNLHQWAVREFMCLIQIESITILKMIYDQHKWWRHNDNNGA